MLLLLGSFINHIRPHRKPRMYENDTLIKPTNTVFIHRKFIFADLSRYFIIYVHWPVRLFYTIWPLHGKVVSVFALQQDDPSLKSDGLSAWNLHFSWFMFSFFLVTSGSSHSPQTWQVGCSSLYLVNTWILCHKHRSRLTVILKFVKQVWMYGR